MKSLTNVAIFIFMVFTLGCGETESEITEEKTRRSRCSSKCDEASAVTTLRFLENLTLVVTGTEFHLTAKTLGDLQSQVNIDIEIDGEAEVFLQMFPSMDGTSYDTKNPFALPEAYETLTIYAWVDIDEVEYLQEFTFDVDSDVGVESLEQANNLGSDPFAEAKDVEAAVITIALDVQAPAYVSADVHRDFGLRGTEFWQKWPGGENPTYSYSVGTEEGRKCIYASARRFEAVMADPPQSLIDLYEGSNWRGGFFSWNDDYSSDKARDLTRGSALWAWKTHLVKWISQTGKDGECHLPTKSMVDRFAKIALEKSESEGGEIKGARSQ